MPSPAALARYVIAIIAAPINQGDLTPPMHEGAITAATHNQAPFNTHGLPNHPVNLQPYGGTSGIYMCVDGGFTGYCRWMSAPFGQCSKCLLVF